MFHVPGKYSGASAEAFAWTQTRESIELTVPLALDAKGSVAFGARRLTVRAADGADDAPVLDGELHDVVVVDECVWTREDSPRQLSISLRKAVPAVWTRLFLADAEHSPVLLDGQRRKGAPDPLAAAAAAAAGAPASAPAAPGAAHTASRSGALPQSAAVPHVLSGLAAQSVELRAADLPPVAVLLLRDCTDLTVRLAPDATVVKVSADGCSRLSLELAGRVTTETCELYRCNGARVIARTSLRTVQIDECVEVALAFDSLTLFECVVQQAVRSLSISFADHTALAVESGVDALRPLAADPTRAEFTAGLAVDGEQFITRLRPAARDAPTSPPPPPQLLTEHVRRLANDYPTTAREAREHAERTSVRAAVLGGGEGGAAAALLGTAGDTMSAQAKAELARLAASADAEATAAARDAHAAASVATELATRAAAKRAAGNAAFGRSEWHEAAVRYTEALALLDSAPPRAPAPANGDAAPVGSATAVAASAAVTTDAMVAVRANRAAAFLKLGRYEQALADADGALALAPTHAKAAFRRGLALQALDRYAEAIGAFSRAVELEPGNGQATAALRMAEMQLRRQRAQHGH
ncbi:hypothetical protein KFE25_003701 [Diacronema lutheri]|uniref:CS domain-containing protein n=1 Tax=Diacronema lutheri TaxID=2081491 RepID=A0A8J5XHK7_DIALT|nr:hypothetical protein KFE25_003701 [Diacronema lutheri]